MIIKKLVYRTRQQTKLKKFIHTFVGVSIENAHVEKKKKTACVEPELIKSEDGDDKEKWEHHF